MFFSTTDQRGIIRTGNSIFARISGYSFNELVGAPHSIVRHPDMPAGAFKLMWDRLLMGRSAAAYVQNRTKDGKSYWVFATITPLGDGFLSVRIPPLTGLHEAARRLYQVVRANENRTRSQGASRSATAAAGAHDLERGLRELEFGGFDGFMTEALPTEMAARAALVTPGFAGEGGVGPVAEILRAAKGLGHQLGALVGRLDRYRCLSQALSESSRSTLDAASQLDQAAVLAREGSALVVNEAPVLDNVARVMIAPCHRAVGTMRSVVGQLGALRDAIADLRFRIALARLHSEMVAAFAAEVADGSAPDSSLGEVHLLCQALHEGVTSMAAAMTDVNDTLAVVAEAVHVAGGLFGEFRMFAAEWRRLVLRRHAGWDLASHVHPIDQMLHDSYEQLDKLRVLADRCGSEIFLFDQGALDAQLDTISAALGRL